MSHPEARHLRQPRRHRAANGIDNTVLVRRCRYSTAINHVYLQDYYLELSGEAARFRRHEHHQVRGTVAWRAAFAEPVRGDPRLPGGDVATDDQGAGAGAKRRPPPPDAPPRAAQLGGGAPRHLGVRLAAP